jgi:phage I-like protein
MNYKWYPSSSQLTTPDEHERAMRETLRQLYDLQDRFDELHKKVNAPAVAAPQQNTAAVTRILGLPIKPSDTSQLVDGTVLTWVAAERVFKFL